MTPRVSGRRRTTGRAPVFSRWFLPVLLSLVALELATLKLFIAHSNFVSGAEAAAASQPHAPAAPAPPELVLQTGHEMRVDGLAFSPDGRLLATGSADNTVKLWETATGRELRTIAGHKLWVKSVAFSADGRQLASGSVDGDVKVWDVATGREARVFTGCGSVNVVAFSPDGRTVAAGNMDNVVKLLDVASGREAATLTTNTGWITALAFSPDGRLLATGSKDNKVRIYDAAAGRELHALAGHTDRVRTLAFSPDSKTIASGGFDAKVRLWNAAAGAEERVLSGHAAKIVSVAYTRDGARLVSTSADHVVKVWDAAAGRELQSAGGGGADLAAVEAAAFDADARTLALSTGDKTVTLFAVNTPAETRTLNTFSSGVHSAALSPDGRWIATGGRDHKVNVWEAATGRKMLPLKGHTGLVTALAFSADGERLISAGEDHTIRVWDVSAGVEERTLPRQAEGVAALAISPDGNSLASGGEDRAVVVWDLKAGRESFRLEGHEDAVTSLAFSPDGKTIASTSTDGTAKLWDVAARKQTHALAGHAREVTSVSFSPDGKTAATASADGAVKLWDAAAGRETATIKAHADWVNAVAFSPDGARLVSAGRDQLLKVWDVRTSQALQTLAGHAGPVNTVAFTPDGRWILSGGEDGGARVWQASGGALAATLVALREGDDWLVTSPDGLFDGSPAAWQKILWRFEQSTLNVRPVEVFFNEFYQPGLLAMILDGRRPVAAKSIAQVDRRQPGVRVSLADAQPGGEVSARDLKVKIELAEQPADRDHTAGSGVRDVRLFRNGSLVRVWRGDQQLDTSGRAVIEATVPLLAGENKLTAYAFNRDNIKAEDSSVLVRGAESLRRKATAHILAVGVNEYANKAFNLKYAVKDADVFSAEVRRAQSALGSYQKVEVTTVYDREATKARILEAFAQLAAKAQPEDAVVVYFAGHGLAVGSRFYLIPHDLGYQGPRGEATEEALRAITQNGISDREMESAFERLDAGQLLMVIDACNSGQALEAEEKRRGPMNSKGLAQLAYEKGMHILTASQSFQAALEVASLGHGLLTYALVEEGLKTGRADNQPRDGQVVLSEWLRYASEQVPRMQRSKMSETRGIGLSTVAFVEGDEKIADAKKRSLQRPRVFYRSETEAKSFVVSKLLPAAAGN